MSEEWHEVKEPELERCEICTLPLEAWNRFSCPRCAERGYETLFCFYCSQFHHLAHKQEERARP